MYSFMVLGIIPGTDIQISFQAWLAVTIMSLGFGPIIWRGARQHYLSPSATHHPILHASLLHIRAL